MFVCFTLFPTWLISKEYTHWTYKNILRWYKFVSVLRVNPTILFHLAASSLPLSDTSFYEAMHWITGEILQMLGCSHAGSYLVHCVTACRAVLAQGYSVWVSKWQYSFLRHCYFVSLSAALVLQYCCLKSSLYAFESFWQMEYSTTQLIS